MFLFCLLIKPHLCAFLYTMFQGNTLVPQDQGRVKVKLNASISQGESQAVSVLKVQTDDMSLFV